MESVLKFKMSILPSFPSDQQLCSVMTRELGLVNRYLCLGGWDLVKTVEASQVWKFQIEVLESLEKRGKNQNKKPKHKINQTTITRTKKPLSFFCSLYNFFCSATLFLSEKNQGKLGL